MEHQKLFHGKRSLVNRSLLSAKLFTLLLSAGQTTLIPFLPMYFRFLGLTAFQTGILGCARSLVCFWASPLLRIFAERTSKRRCLLLAFLLAAVIFNISLGLTSKANSDFRAYICSRVTNTTLVRTAGIQNSTMDPRTNQTYIRGSNKVATGAANNINRSSNLSGSTSAESQIGTNQSTAFVPGMRDLSWKRPVTLVNLGNGTRTNSNSSQVGFVYNISTSEVGAEAKLYLVYGFKMDHMFKVLFSLVLFCELFSSSMRGISRSLFSDISLYNKGANLGNSLLGSLGSVLGGLAIIVVIGYYRCNFGLKNSFYLHFYVFAFFGTAAFVLGTLLKDYEQKSFLNLRFGRTFLFVCCDVQILCFLAVLLVLGMAESLMYNFMMWYLQDINASLTVMGLIIVVSASSEIPMHCISRHLIRCVGHQWVVIISLFSYAGRFLYFSYFRNPWLIIPIELLHGFSCTAVHSACASYASTSSLQGTEKTMKVIFSSVYYGLGMGLGGISVSLLYQLYGPVVIFRCAAGVCGAYAVVSAMLHCILVFPDGDRRGGKLMEYQQISLGGEKYELPHQAADWLMEALQAEEDAEDETHFMR